MIHTTQTARVGQLARVLAPDDFKTGIYVAVLRVRVEFLSCGFFGAVTSDTELVTFSIMPCDDDIPAAMRVVEFCLPFVLVRKPCGKTITLDTRRYALVQVSKEFGKSVFGEAKRLRREAEGKKKRSKGKRSKKKRKS